MKSLELFSGAGGLAKGLEMAGFDHLAFVEFNCDACQTLRTNFDPSKVFEGDVRDYDFSKLDPIDMVAGGPPCQPFSLGGKHKASDDLRDMFPYAIAAINVLRPKAFIFENVKATEPTGGCLSSEKFKERMDAGMPLSLRDQVKHLWPKRVFAKGHNHGFFLRR